MTKARPPNPTENFIGKRLRHCRIQNGLTQSALGAKLGITYQQLQKYESGKNRISASRLYEVACILNVELIWFFPASESADNHVDSDVVCVPANWAALWRDLSCLPVEARRAYINLGTQFAQAFLEK